MRMLRWIFITVLSLALLGGLVLGGLSWWGNRKLGPDFWVALIEENTNGRAYVGSANINPFTRPATVTLTDLRLAPRDEEVARPYSERSPLDADAAAIVVPEARMEVRLEDLVNRRLYIQRLRFVRPVVKETQDQAGNSSLEQLFSRDAPVVVEAPARYYETPPGQPPQVPMPPVSTPPPGPPQPAPNDVPRAIPLAEAPPAVVVDPAPPEAQSADPNKFRVDLLSAEVVDGSLNIVSQDTKVNVSGLNLAITGLDFYPQSGKPAAPVGIAVDGVIDVNGMARIGGAKQPAELAHLVLAGTGQITQEVRNGELISFTRLRLGIAKGSVLAGHVTMGDAAGKEMRKLQEYGVDLGPVPIGGPLLADTVVEGVFALNRFTLTSPCTFSFPEYELFVEQNSWVNSTEDQHLMRVRLACAPTLQQRLESGVAQARLGESLARGVIAALSDERGRMTFDIVSSGALSSPEVKPSLDRILKNLIRGQGLGDLLRGLLK